jgi:hypothetical protein
MKIRPLAGSTVMPEPGQLLPDAVEQEEADGSVCPRCECEVDRVGDLDPAPPKPRPATPACEGQEDRGDADRRLIEQESHGRSGGWERQSGHRRSTDLVRLDDADEPQDGRAALRASRRASRRHGQDQSQGLGDEQAGNLGTPQDHFDDGILSPERPNYIRKVPPGEGDGTREPGGPLDSRPGTPSQLNRSIAGTVQRYQYGVFTTVSGQTTRNN